MTSSRCYAIAHRSRTLYCYSCIFGSFSNRWVIFSKSQFGRNLIFITWSSRSS